MQSSQGQGLGESSIGAQNTITSLELTSLSLTNRWIVSRCHNLVEKCVALLDDHNFGEAGRIIYEFAWDDFADWFIEVRSFYSFSSSRKNII